MSNYKDMTEEELKKEFIKFFGEEKWNQEEILAKVQKVVMNVCINWLGVEPIPVLFGENIGTDEARYDVKEDVIWLNPKNQNKWIELVDSCIHELEHKYQILYVTNRDTPKAKRWKKELNNYIGSKNPVGNLCQEIEIDAMAFAQVVLSTDYGITYRNPNDWLQALIDEYIVSRKILNDN